MRGMWSFTANHLMTSIAVMSVRDFDFLIGKWNIRNSRLKERLAGSTDWEEFDATSDAQLLPGSLGNMDVYSADAWRPGFIGFTTRIYDPKAERWSIYWVDNARFAVDPPVVGSFCDGVGIFEGDDQHEGTPVRVRFTWTHPTPSTARWEQAFSADGGATWETNWIMNMARAD